MTALPDGVLGLAPRTVLLCEPDPRWSALYQAERLRLDDAIGSQIVTIEHFGSTSIPGIKAKPIIDIMVGLARFDDGVALVSPMVALGYDYVGTDMVPDDHLFGLERNRTHLVHAVVHDGHHWRRNLRFRDRLRSDKGLAMAYEHLKIELAARFADSRKDYTAGKQAFIDAIADS